MNTSHQCQLVRDKIFDYRRGDLSEVDRALFEEQMLDCEECAMYISRMVEMMDLAASDDAWVDADLESDAQLPDRMFDAIAATIAATSDTKTDAAPVVQLNFPQLDETPEEEEVEVSSTSWRPILIAAALLVVGGGAFYAWQHTEQPTQPAPKVAKKQPAPEEHIKTTPKPTPEPKANETSDATPVLASLTPQNSQTSAIKVFADNGAKWKVVHKAKQHTLHLESGTVLVEFLPENGETLKVVAGQTTVDVVGTVFYVSKKTRRARVGVLTGKVKVQRRDHQEAQTTVLSDGQALEQDKVQTLHQEDAAQTLVNLTQHRQQLAVLKHSEPEQEVKKPQQPPQKVKPALQNKPVSLNDLRKQAHQAMVERQYVKAIKINETILTRLKHKGHEAASIQLEIANIYMSRLGNKAQAAKHLKRFVKDHPHDVATPNATKQLCTLLGEQAKNESLCPAQ